MLRPLIAFGVLFAPLATGTVAAEGDNTSGKLVELMSRPRVQSELNLTAEQVQQLNAIYRSRISRSRELKTDQMDSLPINERMEVFKAVSRAFGELDTEAVQLLAPEQRLRLSQLYAQYSTLGHKASFRLLSPIASPMLQITDSQRQFITARLTELKAEVESRSVKNLSHVLEHQESLLEVLSDEQRMKFIMLYGEIAPGIWEEAILRELNGSSASNR